MGQAQHSQNDEIVWEMVRELSDVLPKATFAQAMRYYAQMIDWVKQEVYPNWLIAEVCKADRFLLLTHVLNHTLCLNPWIYERCREVEANPDGYLDLWSRGHFKSSIISFGGSFQEIIRDPEITICILSNDNKTARKFLKQIKDECEENPKLHYYWPHIFYEKPQKESRLWSMDNGIVVKRKTIQREPTVFACGLVDSQPTGSHFRLRIYDDTVTEDSVGTPDQIIKTTDRWELSQSLSVLEMEGGFKARQWHAGTKYSFADTYAVIEKRGSLKMRVYPATKDGTFDGVPVLLTEEAWANIKRDESRSTVACQRLLNPLAGENQEFRLEWVQRWEVRPERMNVYITVDPANSRKAGSCNTAYIVQGIDTGGNRYFLDGAVHKMGLRERWEMLLYLWMKWSKAPGVMLCEVGYERYGLQADIDYFEEEMRRMPANKRIVVPVTEVNWVREGSNAKDDRIRRLIPDMQKRKFFWPYEGEDTRNMMRARDAGKDYLVAKPIMRVNELKKTYNVCQYILDNEYVFFPATTAKDAMDAMSRIYDLGFIAPGPVYRDEQLIPPHAGEV